jgi:hypothetical protein
MKPSKRVTRPSLERKAPIRAWATLFGAPNGTAPGASNGAAPGAPRAASGRTSGAANGAGAPRASGAAAVQRGVEFAYRVSEEYLRQGQAMAQAFSQPFSQSFPAPFSTNGARGGSEGGLAQLTERMLRYTAELSSMWMDAARMMPQNGLGAGLGAGGFGAAGPGVPRWPAEAPRAPAPPASPPRGLAIQLDSKARARATLDVRGPVGRSVRVEPPKLAGGKARITAVKIESEDRDGPIVVSVKIPARQAVGTYAGDVLDADTGVPVGTVTIKVSR